MERRITSTIGCTLVAIMALLVSGCASASEPLSTPSAAVESGEWAELAESYQLSYTSDCGDGPYISFGTDIEVRDGVVEVVGGEEPSMVGALAVWQELANAARANGTVVTVQTTDGVPVSMQIADQSGIDTEFCVDITNYKLLGR